MQHILFSVMYNFAFLNVERVQNVQKFKLTNPDTDTSLQRFRLSNFLYGIS